jgi:UPF0755 protein
MKTKIILSILVIVGGVLLYKYYPLIQLYWQQTEKTSNIEEQAFYVRSGSTLDELEAQLISEGVIEEKSAFRNIAEYKDLNDDNIGAGKYLIKKNYKVSHLINGFKVNSLGNGNGEIEVQVTFNNCRDLQQMAGRVAKFIETDSLTLITLLESPDLIQKFGFDAKTFPAMFIPNTYNMFWDTNAEQFVSRMADEFKRFWTPDRLEKAGAINLSQSKVVTLASVVYAEQSLAKDEWPIIAGLYINRLKQGMKLQSDPTFKFCWGRDLDNNRRLYNKHREIDCPYNTYLYSGLPPGPINIPPAACVDAVLNYQNHDYIFMCAQANNSGKHNFTKSYEVHQKNAEAFRKWMDDRGIK